MEYKYNDNELLYLIREGTIEAEDILYDKYIFLIKKRISSFKIQKRYKDNDQCSNKKIKYSSGNCSDKTKFLKNKTATFNGKNYFYIKTSCSSKIEEALNNYDNDG